MEVKLIGSLDYEKLKKELINKNVDNVDDVINLINDIEKEGRVNKVATAGRLSRFAGDVFEVLELSENKTYEQNINFVKRVINMGHDSITDHDYLVFAIKDVSPVIEQTIIEERFSSFTIKSRREVDFSKVGFYTPDFHDLNGDILNKNDDIKEEYDKYMQSLFNKYSYFIDNDISKEDARFILPYSYYSNIIMGVDAHTLKDIIIKYTKTKYSKIQELREFGENLYNIAEENIPYIVDEIDKVPIKLTDPVDEYLNKEIGNVSYKVLDAPKLISSSDNIDYTIMISAIMRRYQTDYEKSYQIYQSMITKNPNFTNELMKKIAFEGDKLELSQVSFEFQIPLSFAVLTHLTRHRTHHIMVPPFAPNVDLTQYKIPPKFLANKELLDEFNNVFKINYKTYNEFKNNGIWDNDLVYFTLSGNTVKIVTNLDGKTVEHILGLRECSKAQWETQAMAVGMHREISKLKDAKEYSSILGSTCMTKGYCKEGKESCGKIKKLINK